MMSDVISSWQGAVYVAGSNILSRFFNFLPNLLGALIVFFLGLILAKWGRTIVAKVLGAIRLDKLINSAGLHTFLAKADIKVKVEIFLSEVVRWLIIAVFSIAAINILGLTTVSAVLTSLLAYIPSILSAVIILTIGVLLASLVENLVKGTVSQVEAKTARLLAKIASYLVMIVAILAAINELGIAESLTTAIFTGLIATLTLGIGLAIGLGGKDVVSKMLMDWYTQFKDK
jgi:hypothetical protein